MRSCACWGVGLAALHFSATDSCTAAAAGSCASSPQAQYSNTLNFHERHCKAYLRCYALHPGISSGISSGISCDTHCNPSQGNYNEIPRHKTLRTQPWHSGAYTCRGHKQRAQAAGKHTHTFAGEREVCPWSSETSPVPVLIFWRRVQLIPHEAKFVADAGSYFFISGVPPKIFFGSRTAHFPIANL